MRADWDIAQAQKSGYPHYMLKEIYEQPKALRDTLHPRIRAGKPDFTADNIPADFFAKYEAIHITACGTAMYAGMVGKNVLEKLARIRVDVDLASEFRYRDPILSEKDLVIVISQSGETADSLAALRLAKQRGLDTLAIVNVTGSSIAREADYVLQTYAGPEIAVASTKAFSVQIGVLYLLAIAMAGERGLITSDEQESYIAELLRAVEAIEQILTRNGEMKELARHYTDVHSLFYLGRGLDHALAMEGSLKLKEISYIHSEAYAAGELKHGTISLITEGVPVVGLATQENLLAKTISNIKETKARGGEVTVITKEGFEIDGEVYDHILRLPALRDILMPIPATVVLQLLAYYTAVQRGCDVDKPRNLAKSVTVE
jgi:glucosamine--fructose-6-phosphate aminotransferase (isomerizing)